MSKQSSKGSSTPKFTPKIDSSVRIIGGDKIKGQVPKMENPPPPPKE